MLKAIEDKLINLKARSAEINNLLIQRDIASDIKKYTQLNKELAEILPIVEAFDEMNDLKKQKQEAKLLLNNDDNDIISLAEIGRAHV